MTKKRLNSVVLNAVQRNKAESPKPADDELKEAYQELMRNNAVLLAENIEWVQTVEELRKQKEILQKIFDNIPILINLVGEEGQIDMVNREWEHRLGWTLEEIRQEQLDIYTLCFSEPQERQKVLELIAEENGEWRDFKTTVRDGHVIDTTWARIKLSDGTRIGIGQDISERKQAEGIISQKAAYAQLLVDISQAFAEARLDYRECLRTIARRTAELIGDGCVIFQYSDDQMLSWSESFYHPNPQVLAMMRKYYMKGWSSNTNSIIFRTLLSGEPVRIPVVSMDDIRPLIIPEFWEDRDHFIIYSLLAVPLRAKGQVIGALSLSRDQTDHPYTLEDQILLQDIADRAALTIENARLFQSVSQKSERLRALSVRLVEAHETERRTVARELHDEVGQMLTGLQITLKMSSQLDQDAARANLGEAQGLAEQLLDKVHNLSLDLRPAVLDDLGLMPALLSHFERYTHQTGIRVRFDHRGINRRFASEVETAAYRIIQEGLTNVARHAGVQEAVVRVWADDDTLGLQIEDLGAGFDVQSVLTAHTSSGLSGMQEQAELLGGQLTIESTYGSGTLITGEIPMGDSKGGHDDRDNSIS